MIIKDCNLSLNIINLELLKITPNQLIKALEKKYLCARVPPLQIQDMKYQAFDIYSNLEEDVINLIYIYIYIYI